MDETGEGRTERRCWHPDFDPALLAPNLPLPLARPVAIGRDDPVPEFLWGSVLLLGNFDGLHVGHRRLLEAARRQAALAHAPLAIMSCEPHPKHFFDPHKAPFRLSTVKSKLITFGRLGIDLIYMPRFDAGFASLSANAFVAEILVGQLGVRAVVVGRDFRFGRQRCGSLADLAAWADAGDYDLVVVDDLEMAGARVSSSRIRAWIAAGEIERAVEAIGDNWLTPIVIGHAGHAVFDSTSLLPPPGRYQVTLWTREGSPIGRFTLALNENRTASIASWPGAEATGFLSAWSLA